MKNDMNRPQLETNEAAELNAQGGKQLLSGTLPQAPAMPEGATHMRRPEYIEAWLFDRISTMPIWLIARYKSRPLPDDKIGHYATATDGEFWRWFDPAKFDEMFTPISPSRDLEITQAEIMAIGDTVTTLRKMGQRYSDGGLAANVPAQMQGSNDRGLAQDAERPEDTMQGDRPAHSVTCSSEPVAWQKRPLFVFPSFWTEIDGDPETLNFWREKDYEVRPLYAAPVPHLSEETVQPVDWKEAVQNFIEQLQPAQQVFHSDGTVQASWLVEDRMFFTLDFTEALQHLATAAPKRPFHGAECSSYPNCNGGCGLGCTKEMMEARAVALVRRFEHESMALHKAQREWLVREISAALNGLGARVQERGE